MIAPKLYYVRKIPFAVLKKSQRMIETEVDETFWVSQQDNMLFRQIRLVTGDGAVKNPYITFVSCKGAKNDGAELALLIREGFQIGKQRFRISESSASMTRNSILSFIDEDIYAEMEERITMGRRMEKTVLSKWYAYRGLMLSSCHLLAGWKPKIVVVPDYMQTIKDQTIKCVYDQELAFTDKQGNDRTWVQKDIKQTLCDVTVNTFDGCGIHHPAITSYVQEALGLPSRPTSILWRAPFIKGVTHEIDYTAFWSKRGVKKIRDIWGVEHDIHDEMILITKSMYKGMGYFEQFGDERDWQSYWERFDRYQHCIGVAKYNFTKEEEAVYTRANYQILQDLELDYVEFAKLAGDSIQWLTKIVSGDPLYTYCFLGLDQEHAHAENPYMKALLKNPEMMKEQSVRKYFLAQVQKYLKEMKCGKLWIKSCFKLLAPDLILLLEWIGGLPLRGAMDSGEFYAPGACCRSGADYLIERNPHICKSEHTILKSSGNPLIETVCGHLENVCLVNSKSLTPQRLNGADYDGDLVLLVDNDLMLRGVDREAAIVLDMEDKVTALEEENSMDKRIALIQRTMQSLIGETSNCATAYHNKMPKTAQQKQRYDAFIDLLSVINGKAIDFAKTGVLFHIPPHIAKYAKPLPYFMKFAGDYYRKLRTFSYANSNMNRLCRDIEKWEKQLMWPRQHEPFDHTIMMDSELTAPAELEKQIEAVFLAFCAEMSELAKYQAKIRQYDAHIEELREVISREDACRFTLNWKQYYETYRQRCAELCPDQKLLANIAVKLCYETYPKKNKSFIWRVAGEGVVQNIKQVPVKLPRRDDQGEACYLGKRYSFH